MSAPTVLMSSRDGHLVPAVANAARLAVHAERLGWTVRVTYALAQVPDHYHANGNLAKAGHRLATVAVRLRRGPSAGFAAWQKEGDGRWGFTAGVLDCKPYGFKALLAELDRREIEATP